MSIMESSDYLFKPGISEYTMKPKFKRGDIVDILPYGDFTEHIAIPEKYWNELYLTNPHIITTVIPCQHVRGKHELIENIYYDLGDGFSYGEEFLTKHIELLPDDLFEV